MLHRAELLDLFLNTLIRMLEQTQKSSLVENFGPCGYFPKVPCGREQQSKAPRLETCCVAH